MKIRKKMMALAVSGMMTITCFSASIPAVQTSLNAVAADDNNDDWLHAEGSRLYDSEGHEVWLTGANWFGFNCTENCAHGLYAADVDDFLENVSNHGINLIRMPISTELLVSWMEGKPLDVSSVNAGNDPPYFVVNPDFVLEDGKTLKNSMEIFDVIMQKMKKYGLKVMVDVHSPASHNSGHNYNLWYYESSAADADNMATGFYSSEQITWDMWKDSITWLADKYSNDDTIIGYDLKNEPHGKRGYSGSSCPSDIAKWDNSTDQNNWAYSATECANSVLSVNPNALIFIEGVEQYPKTEKGYTYDTPDIWQASADVSPWYGAWWGGNLRGVKDYPIEPDSGTSQIVYSPHDYGPSVYNQTWFDKDFTTQTLLDDYWYDTWAYINDQEIAPLLIGEWGGHMDGGDNEKWMTLLRDYMINNHINHTFWGLNPNSGDTGGLLGYDFATWDDEKYNMFEESLWQTLETGKYISLDHQRALGTNGSSISLSEFYSSYASKEGSNLDGGTIWDGKTGSSKPVETGTGVSTTTGKEETTTTVTTSEKPAVIGDITQDGTTDMADLIQLLKFLLGQKTDDGNIQAGDVNGDGIVNGIDLALYRQVLSKAIDAFPQ
ncbi:cellulase family glycosylhydrolase [uncultured Ruminococcus sp.]|uniref:cellulase family glycosylhydrolase n=1 Tax=uncultured Ruminococcus sp. TaxID=165186 RepID=UPI002602D109|nr:cellulase family glycosylhydrolase [uncultured Ruminococcus sp.]